MLDCVLLRFWWVTDVSMAVSQADRNPHPGDWREWAYSVAGRNQGGKPEEGSAWQQQRFASSLACPQALCAVTEVSVSALSSAVAALPVWPPRT